MLFKPDLSKCKENQIKILDLWQKDIFMSKLLKHAKRVLTIPDSVEIYNRFSGRNNSEYIHKNNINNEFLALLDKYYSLNEYLYVLYSGRTCKLNRIGFLDQAYPIFYLNYVFLKRYFSELIYNEDFFSLIVSDVNFNTVIDLSNIDNHIEEPEHVDKYTISYKIISVE